MLFSKKESIEKKEPKVKASKEKKPKRLRKRFSILEVTSIVAVLAVLGTVGFLVYKNHFRKQTPETDKELVNQLNQSVSKNFPKGGELDLTKVIDGIENDGIIFSKLKFADTNSELIFDSSKNIFGIFESKKGVTYPVEIERNISKIDTTLWKFANKNPGDKINPFSYYLLDGCQGKLTVVGGVDVGKNEDIERINYINANDIKQTVVIKTNSFETELTITETVGDTINHYGRLGKLTVNRLHIDSYHEYGDTKYAYIPAGRVVAENSGNIDVAIVASEVAFVQEKGSGKIGRAFATTERIMNSSKKTDEKYGKKKELEYDENLSRDDNEERAIIVGEAALNKAIVEERIERGFEKHPNAIGYTREDDTITIFDSLKEAVEFFSDGREGVVNVTGNETLTEDLLIKDVNVTFRGDEQNLPVISGNLVIEHTSGSHNIKFENIVFRNSNSGKDTILDHSKCENENAVNNLEIKNCKFIYDSSKPSNKAAICLAPVDNYIGTLLTVGKSTFENVSSGQIAITTRGLVNSSDSINRGEKILSYKHHVIDSNTFTCANMENSTAIVASYTDITNNTFKNYHTAIKFVPTLLEGNLCQFDVSVSENSFENINYLFSIVDLDDCFESSEFVFNFFGSNSNSFTNVNNIATFDVSTTNKYIESKIDEWTDKSWYGVKNQAIGVTLDAITMNLETSPVPGFLTLSNGERIKTYTEVENPLEGRTGYTIKDADENLYYYYTTFNKEVNVFFKNDTNEAYIALLSDGDVESLKVKELTSQPDWLDEDLFDDEALYQELKYYDLTQEEKVGALYKVDDVFTCINGNTFVNSIVEQKGGYIELTKIPVEQAEPEPGSDPIDPILPKKIDAFISDIEDKTKLIITNEEPLVVNSDEYIIVLPNDSSVVLSGNFDVELRGTVEELSLFNQLRIVINEGSVVSESIVISGEKAEDLKLTNRGTIEKLVVNSKSEITNYNVINDLITGDISNVKEKCVAQVLNNTIDATIYNKGNIYNITTFAKTRLFNKQGGIIENLVVTYIEGFRDLCAGSLIINDNIMCINNGNIYLYIECTFMNESTGRIGTISRSTPGGCIIIGDHGTSDAHNRVVFINDGNIRVGRLDESTVATFVVYGTNEGVSESSPKVRIESSGVISGTTSDEEVLLVINCDTPPIIDKDIKL